MAFIEKGREHIDRPSRNDFVRPSSEKETSAWSGISRHHQGEDQRLPGYRPCSSDNEEAVRHARRLADPQQKAVISIFIVMRVHTFVLTNGDEAASSFTSR